MATGLPRMTITFQTLGMTAVQRSEKGIVALILRDTKKTGAHVLSSVTDIPVTWGMANQKYVARAFTGYVNPPRQVLVYVLKKEEEALADGLRYFELYHFDYLAGPPDLTEEEAATTAAWIKSRRLNHRPVKAVLPHTPADHEGIINFTAEDILVSGDTYSAAEYCSRIAGLIAGTPMTIACTFAPLPEVTDVRRRSNEELDEAIKGGEFVLFHGGKKVKVGRGVNSLVSTTDGKGADFQKIKIVEVVDMIDHDLRTTAEDSYLGKYANSYDNKCLLFEAEKAYLRQVEKAGILEPDTSVVELDLEAQTRYLEGKGIDTSEMSEQEIRKGNTGSHVFQRGQVSILDAIEDIELNITML